MALDKILELSEPLKFKYYQLQMLNSIFFVSFLPKFELFWMAQVVEYVMFSKRSIQWYTICPIQIDVESNIFSIDLLFLRIFNIYGASLQVSDDQPYNVFEN